MQDIKLISIWNIYKLTNPLGQVYVGRTRNLKNRIRQYRSPAHHKHHLASASVKQYGFDNHSFEVIDTFEGNEEYASGKEIFWIRTLMSNRTQWPEMNGLNLTKGGQGQLGRPTSEKQKTVVSQMMKGHTHNKGRKHTLEARQKISIAQTGRKLTGNWLRSVSENNKARNSKPIVQLNELGQTVKEFESITKAAAELGINKRSIRLVLQGFQKSTSGYFFKTKKDAVIPNF